MSIRDLARLANDQFDIVVVGGGASGAATAREAALRGLRTALIEKGDFGEGSSAHCFKMVHGGIRYLQHADFPRLRASSHERSAMLRLAPHLVSPLPIAIPTYGWGKRGKPLLGTGMLLYDLLSADRNRHIRDTARRFSATRFLSTAEVLDHFPDIDRTGLTGAAVFEDGQMYSPQRLVWAFAAAARQAGAVVANHVEATGALVESGRVTGVRAVDRISGETFDVSGSFVINASGPWAEGLLASAGIDPARYRGTYSRDTCFVIDRRYQSSIALALQGQSLDSDAVVGRGARHMFLVPWRDKTLVGVWHRVVPREPDSVGLPEAQLQSFIDEMNAILPSLRLSLDDVRMAGFGLVPFGEHQHGGATLSFGKESKIIDHARQDGVQGMISVISVRYTVARKDAALAVDLACRRAELPSRELEPALQPLPGGDFDDFNALLAEARASAPGWLGAAGTEALVRNHGTGYRQVIDLAKREPSRARVVDGTQVSQAEVAHACREELAVTLCDVLFRRTEIGTGEAPSATAINEVTGIMAREHGWGDDRMEREMDGVTRHLQRYWGSRRGVQA